MKKAIILALAMSVPLAATAGEKSPKMDAASIEKTVRVSSKGATGAEMTFMFLTALMFATALSGGAPVGPV